MTQESVALYEFEREARTAHSECWSIEREGDAVGRVDLHFTPSSQVHATLCVTDEIDDDELQDLIAEIDERLVLPSDAYRDDFVVTVWRGVAAGVYSEDEGHDDDPAPAPDGGGRPHTGPA